MGSFFLNNNDNIRVRCIDLLIYLIYGREIIFLKIIMNTHAIDHLIDKY